MDNKPQTVARKSGSTGTGASPAGRVGAIQLARGIAAQYSHLSPEQIAKINEQGRNVERFEQLSGQVNGGKRKSKSLRKKNKKSNKKRSMKRRRTTKRRKN